MSSGVMQNCPPPPNPICIEILQKIMDFIFRDKKLFSNEGTHGLIYRFAEQINGQNGPGTVSWSNHEKAIQEQQRALEKKLREYDKNKCGPPPPGAWSWATRPVPLYFEWRGPAVIPRIWGEPVPIPVGDALKLGAAGYVAYRVIRFLPSLLPPLWGTIPANAAIP